MPATKPPATPLQVLEFMWARNVTVSRLGWLCERQSPQPAQNASFFHFSCVWPKPVLVKRSLVFKMAPKRVFSAPGAQASAGAAQARPIGGVPQGLPVGFARRLFVPPQLAPHPRTAGCEHNASQLPSLQPTTAGGPGGAGGGSGGGGGGSGGGGATLGSVRLGNSVTGLLPRGSPTGRLSSGSAVAVPLAPSAETSVTNSMAPLSLYCRMLVVTAVQVPADHRRWIAVNTPSGPEVPLVAVTGPPVRLPHEQYRAPPHCSATCPSPSQSLPPTATL